MNDNRIRLVSYFEQLDALAVQARINLLHAFIKAGVPSSTYYRTVGGAELRYETASKVASFLRRQLKQPRRNSDAANGAAAGDGQSAVVQ
ncbi:MAG: hypothetical protein LW689_04465 [Novosphingobium sp.]|nr:hypothetical protein [Novosphingobium sp.]